VYFDRISTCRAKLSIYVAQPLLDATDGPGGLRDLTASVGLYVPPRATSLFQADSALVVANMRACSWPRGMSLLASATEPLTHQLNSLHVHRADRVRGLGFAGAVGHERADPIQGASIGGQRR
jgi:hypothetical protein